MSGFDAEVHGEDRAEGTRESTGQVGNNLVVFDPEAARARRAASDQAAAQAKEKVAAEVDEKLRPHMEILLSLDSEHKDKVDALSAIQTSILPDLLKEISNTFPNTDRSLVASRAIIALREIFKTLNERKSLEASEEIDPHSPKLQMVLGWFLELLSAAMHRQGAEVILINNVFNDIAASLVGWEDITAKKLKGASAKALASVKNPFIESFWDKTKDRPIYTPEE